MEEGIQSIVTSGVATGQRQEEPLSSEMLERVNRRLSDLTIVDRVEEFEQAAADASARLERTARERVADSTPDDYDHESDGDDER